MKRATFVLLGLASCGSSPRTEDYVMPSASMEPTIHLGEHMLVNLDAYRKAAPAPGDVIVFAGPCAPDRKFVKRAIANAGDTVEVRCSVVYVNGVAVASRATPGECSYQDVDDMAPERTTAKLCTRATEKLGGHTYDVLQEIDRHPGPDMHDFPVPEEPALPGCGTGGGVGTIVRGATPAGVCDRQVHYVVPAQSVFVMGDNRPNSADSRIWGAVPLRLVEGRVTLIH